MFNLQYLMYNSHWLMLIASLSGCFFGWKSHLVLFHPPWQSQGFLIFLYQLLRTFEKSFNIDGGKGTEENGGEIEAWGLSYV